ncbi:PAS domain S-box protein [Candidatus Poribacteria bacterium]|nr:PAS domain S-box protein [Candidatus Poribacteria bacterium]
MDLTAQFIDWEGRPVILATLRDASERKRAEAERNLLAAAIEHSEGAVFITDAEGRIKYTNAGFTSITGYPRAEFIGKTLARLESGEGKGRFWENLLATVQRGGIWRDTIMGRRADESPLMMRLVVSPLRDDSGRIMHLVGVGQDITEEHRLREQLRLAQRMEAIGQLAGGIAHDFNNILTTITGCGNLLLEDLPASSQEREDVQEIVEAAGRAAELTKQLLAFSRQQPQELRPVDLNELVLGLQRLLQRLLGNTITLVVQPSLTPVAALGDRSQMEQVVINLCVNARDAMPDGGTLTITAGSRSLDEPSALRLRMNPGEYVTLSVTDTGTGIAPEIRDRIFDPFFTTKTQGQGTGLGLATVYGIVSQSGGVIELETVVGAGSTFRIILPAAAMGAASGAAHPRGRPRGGTEGILLSTDEESVRRLAVRSLRGFGYAVIEAADGAQALRAAESCPKPLDLLVTDLALPGLDGSALAARLREQWPALRVLFICGQADAHEVDRLRQFSSSRLLSKPFTPKDLAWAVRDLLDSPITDGSSQ